MAEGWAKGFASGAGATSGLIMALSVVWLSGAVMAAVAALAGHSLAGWVAYAAYVVQLFVLLRKVGSFGIISALLYPVPLLFFFVVFGASVARGGRHRSARPRRLWRRPRRSPWQATAASSAG